MPEIYPFQIDQEIGSQNADYTFTTKANIYYSISFTEVTRITDLFDDYPVISNGVYLIIEPVNPSNPIYFDANTGCTITSIFQHYLINTDLNSIIIYNCDERDGKQLKRYKKFNRWFADYITNIEIQKIDKELLIPENHPEKGVLYVASYISIMFRLTHPRYERILSEIALATKRINSGKPDTTILE